LQAAFNLQELSEGRFSEKLGETHRRQPKCQPLAALGSGDCVAGFLEGTLRVVGDLAVEETGRVVVKAKHWGPQRVVLGNVCCAIRFYRELNGARAAFLHTRCSYSRLIRGRLTTPVPVRQTPAQRPSERNSQNHRRGNCAISSKKSINFPGPPFNQRFRNLGQGKAKPNTIGIVSGDIHPTSIIRRAQQSPRRATAVSFRHEITPAICLCCAASITGYGHLTFRPMGPLLPPKRAHGQVQNGNRAGARGPRPSKYLDYENRKNQ